MSLTKPEFDEWLQHPVTAEVRGMLGKLIAQHLDAWSQGDFTASTSDATVQMNAKAIGYTQGLQFVQSLSFDRYEEIMIDSPATGAVPSASAFEPRDDKQKEA